MAIFGNGRRPAKFQRLDEWFDDMECERVLDSMCVVETVDIRPQVFHRQESAEWYPAECRALKAMENRHTSTNKPSAAQG
jgi:hypothetical protein